MPAKFEFRLEPVLRLRQRAFEAKQRVVGERLRAIGKEQSLMAAAQAQIADQVSQARLGRIGHIDASSMTASRAHIEFLHRRAAECNRRIAQHERELVRERDEMVAARVAVRSLEKLKERRKERFNAERDRIEAAEQGELAMSLYRRVHGHRTQVVTYEVNE